MSVELTALGEVAAQGNELKEQEYSLVRDLHCHLEGLVCLEQLTEFAMRPRDLQGGVWARHNLEGCLVGGDRLLEAPRIEQFVGDHIDEKNLSIGYASALEVAQSKQGDCSEHAVLAAAICRAAGIPARVATGLVYVEEFMARKTN